MAGNALFSVELKLKIKTKNYEIGKQKKCVQR